MAAKNRNLLRQLCDGQSRRFRRVVNDNPAQARNENREVKERE